MFPLKFIQFTFSLQSSVSEEPIKLRDVMKRDKKSEIQKEKKNRNNITSFHPRDFNSILEGGVSY